MNGFQNGRKRRRDNGQFAPGTAPGPGRPRGSRGYRRMRELLSARLDDRAFAELVDTLVTKAIEGNMAAMKLCLVYSLGKPLSEEDILHTTEFAEQFPALAQDERDQMQLDPL